MEPSSGGHAETDDVLRHRLILELFDNAHVSIWACDRNLQVRLWNKGAEDIYGRTAEEMIGRSYIEMITDQAERDASIKECHRIIDYGQKSRNFLAYDHDTSGRQLYMLTNCFRIIDPETGEKLQAEIGIEISDLEIQRDRHRTLRELGIARRTEKDLRFQQIKDDVIARIDSAIVEVNRVRASVLNEIELFREVGSTRNRSRIESTAVRLKQEIETEHRSAMVELGNLKLNAQISSDETGLRGVADQLGRDSTTWTDRIVSKRPPK